MVAKDGAGNPRARKRGHTVRGIGNASDPSGLSAEERAKVYGEMPALPPKPPVLGPAERAALIPRILELRQQGLKWPLVAQELKVRTAQVERALMEWRKGGSKGPCACGAEGTWQVDPYTLETHGEEIRVFLCEECGL